MRSFRIEPFTAVVLFQNVMTCEDADNDTERTVAELASEINQMRGQLSKGVLESALYCCNINEEDKKFWHPKGYTFEEFLADLLPKPAKFNRYYNVIYDAEKTSPEKA